jgi:PEGA domain-containing protein
METLGEPKSDGGGPRLFVVAVAVALVLAGLAIAFVARRPGKEPRPTSAAARPSPAPRPSSTPETPVARAKPESEPAPRATATSLSVDSDVPGASVFLDRKFLGTTPLTTSGVEPGSHRLNVSAAGFEGYAEPLEIAAGPNEVVVRFKEVRLEEQVAVAHKHAVGTCQGLLRASPAGLRFEASKPSDSFDAAFSTLEPLQVDYLARTLRVKQKGGKTWNFTADSADALLVFQKRVEAARARL